MEQEEILMLSLIASLSGIVMLMLKLSYKSKCSSVDCCCGLMRIKREVQLEKDLEPEKTTEQKTDQPIGIPQVPQADAV